MTPTFLLENAGEVRRRSVDWEFPVVVKSRRSVSWQLGVGVPGTTCFIHDIEELITVFTMIKQQTSESPLIQPLVRGERYEVELLCHEGVALAEVIHHSLRTISPTSSVSVLRETISSDETELSRELSRVAHKVAKALSWQGPLVVEFKVDADTHIPFLIKINGRFSGVLPLAGFAGVNFPLLYATQLQGNFFEAALITSRPSVVSRYWLGDAQHLLRVWLFRSTTLPHVYPTRRKALRDFFRAYRGVYFDVWQWTDPLPALWQYIDAVNKH